MNNLKFIINLFLLLLIQSFSHLILVGMENNKTIMKLRDLSTFKFWNKTENKYKMNCPIKYCKNNKDKGFSSQSKLENHLICQHHVCPCCQDDDAWKSVDDLLCHFIEWHPCQSPSKKGQVRNCFVCKICNQYICLYSDHFERHKNVCSQPKKYKKRTQKKLSSQEVVTIDTLDNSNIKYESIDIMPCECFPKTDLPDLFSYD